MVCSRPNTCIPVKAGIAEDKGFTLIELMVSIAILSIVSVALMQMFAISARTNSKAYVMDKVNSLCTDTAERFKADPDFPAAAESGFVSAPEGSGMTYTKYLDRNFEDTPGPLPSSGSAYRLDIQVTSSAAIETSAFYYPEAACTYELGSEVTNMTLSQTGSAIVLSANGSANMVDADKIVFSDDASEAALTALVPIRLNCGYLPTTSGEVHLKNELGTILKSGKEYTAVADIYLSGIRPGCTVTVKPEEGVTAQQGEPVSDEKTQNIMYTAVIKISGLSDGRILAENMVRKYWVN